MKKMTRSTRRLIISMLVLALLVMALPMTIVAKGRPADNPGLAKGQNKIDKQKPEGEEMDSRSFQAKLVAARNAWAKSEEIGIPPGHANIMLKYLLATEDFGENPEVEAIMAALQTQYGTWGSEYEAYVNSDGSIDYKSFMGWLKQVKLMKPEDEEEPEETEEADDDVDEGGEA